MWKFNNTFNLPFIIHATGCKDESFVMAAMFPTSQQKNSNYKDMRKKTGVVQVADNSKMFRINWPCNYEWCKNTKTKSFHIPPAYPLFSRCCLSKQNFSKPDSMDKKVVLITGCSSGIGLSLAVRLASDPDKTFKGDQSCHRPLVVFYCSPYVLNRPLRELALDKEQ